MTASSPQHEFSGRRVVITGGTRSIGLAFAIAFAAKGASISICARDPESVRQARHYIARHGEVHAACCDLRRPEQIQRYVAEAAGVLGGIDILINNATGRLSGDGDESWLSAIEVDLLGIVRMTRAAESWLVQAHDAAIINVVSVSAMHATPMSESYGAIKAAAAHLTQSQSARLASRRIRVNAIAPGAIESPDNIWGERRRAHAPAYDRKLATMPWGRLGTPDDIADVALFLASRRARWITGQIIVADGGQRRDPFPFTESVQ